MQNELLDCLQRGIAFAEGKDHLQPYVAWEARQLLTNLKPSEMSVTELVAMVAILVAANNRLGREVVLNRVGDDDALPSFRRSPTADLVQ